MSNFDLILDALIFAIIIILIITIFTVIVSTIGIFPLFILLFILYLLVVNNYKSLSERYRRSNGIIIAKLDNYTI